MTAGLYIVSTPIGNLEDITLRALKILQRSSIILCEDTRVSRKLLSHHSISCSSLQVYNEHSTAKDREDILALINAGKMISLISDAGTPLISDPGYKLVEFLTDHQCYIDVIPGCCSVIAALTISAMPTDSFLFAGFVPKTLVAKEKFFTKISDIDTTLICFETAPRLKATLESALNILGNRQVVVARELTKLYQEIVKDQLANLITYYQTRDIKGEIVIVISRDQIDIDTKKLSDTIENMAKDLISQNISAKDCTKILHTHFKASYNKTALYDMVNRLKSLS